MSKVYLFEKGQYREINNLNALIRHKGSLLIINDAEILKHMELIENYNNNYIFIILNGSEQPLLKELASRNICVKPKRVFIISKETEEKYFNDIPKLLPCIDSWDVKVAELFTCIKKETREFFQKCTCSFEF